MPTRLSIRGKLLALVVLLTLPMAVAIGFLIERGIGKDIRFAEKERVGLDYQRPLFELGVALRHLAMVSAAGSELELDREALRVDDAFDSALRADARDAETLRVTAAALEAEGRDVPPLAQQHAAWATISAAIVRREAPDLDAVDAIANDARRLALLAGDNSNLILDPDLDSYYLMDLTNLAIPDAIVRVARARSLSGGVFADPDGQGALGTLAALIDEVDRPRIAGSTHAALAEDERFYGTSESLAPHLQPALAAHEAASQRLAEALRAASREPLGAFAIEASAQDALAASHALWIAAADELDHLLARRIEVQRQARIEGLLLALAGLVVAALGGRLVARSIARSLDHARALVERVAEGDLASTSQLASDVQSHDETGALIAGLSRMAGSLRRLVAQVAASAASVAELSSRVDETSGELGQRARRQRDAAVDAAVVTQEFAQSIESGSGLATGLLEAAESTCTSMQEIEAQARAIEAEMERFAEIVAQLLSAMDQMAANGQTIATAAVSLRGAGDDVVGSIEDLRGSISSIEDSASMSRDEARAMLENVEQGEAATRQSMAANQGILEAFEGLRSAVAQLQERSTRIEQVLAVIDGVVDEVQLLSLNASIISAQAGEHGRAFSVVALEIGELARTTEASSGEIRKSVRDLQTEIVGVSRSVASGTLQVQNGLACAEGAQATLSALSERARASAQRATAISDATARQSASVAAVERAASTVQGGVIEIGASVEQYSASVRSVRDTVAGVDQLVKPVLSAAARQTGESATVSTSMREVMERAKELGSAATQQRDATARIRAALGVFRDGTEATTSVAGDLGEVVAELRDRMAALSREVTRFQI